MNDVPAWAEDVYLDNVLFFGTIKRLDNKRWIDIEGSDGVVRFVPFVTERPPRCFYCGGTGFLDDFHSDDEECHWCSDDDDDNYGETHFDWDEALEADAFYRLMAQARWLKKRYGTTKVESIADYWIAS